MINQVKIRMAVSQLVGASEVEYENDTEEETYTFTYLGKRITIVHWHYECSEWYLDLKGYPSIEMASIESVVEWIKKLEEYK